MKKKGGEEGIPARPLNQQSVFIVGSVCWLPVSARTLVPACSRPVASFRLANQLEPAKPAASACHCPGARSSTQGSVITSAGKNVHLDSGTRMLLGSQAQTGSQGETKPPAAGKPEPKSEPKPEAKQPNQQ